MCNAYSFATCTRVYLIAYFIQSNRFPFPVLSTQTLISKCVMCAQEKKTKCKMNGSSSDSSTTTPPCSSPSPLKKQQFQEQKSHLSSKQLLKFRNIKTIVYISSSSRIHLCQLFTRSNFNSPNYYIVFIWQTLNSHCN